jgi:hypothetical protein
MRHSCGDRHPVVDPRYGCAQIHPSVPQSLEQRLEHQAVCAPLAIGGLNQAFDFAELQVGHRSAPRARWLERQPTTDPLYDLCGLIVVERVLAPEDLSDGTTTPQTQASRPAALIAFTARTHVRLYSGAHRYIGQPASRTHTTAGGNAYNGDLLPAAIHLRRELRSNSTHGVLSPQQATVGSLLTVERKSGMGCRK